MDKMKVKVCCICGVSFKGYGNNPSPVKEKGTCCNNCNYETVIPERITRTIKEHNGKK